MIPPAASAAMLADDVRPWPAPRVAWTLTALLTLAYVLSFLDRYILGLLVQPIKADLHVSDEQMGYLLGPAFALFYATMSVPLGWLADRARRTWIVAAGVALWSLATAACGLAGGFAQLFLARMTVGIGEATLSPSAMSTIGDSFPPERRGKPIGLYSAALSLGAGLASLIGAALLVWAKTSDGLVLPLAGAVRPWQFAFVAVGLAGLPLAAAFLFLPEPARRDATAAVPVRAASFGAAFRHIGGNLGAFGGLTLLVAVMTIIAYSQGFNPAAFGRTFGWEAQHFAFVNGLLILVVGPATVWTAGVTVDRWRRAGRTDAPFRLLTIGYLVMLPASALPLFMPVPALAFAMLALSSVGIGLVTAAGILALLDITPAAMRGTVTALYYMTISALGLGLGPTTVGLLSTRVFGEANLRAAVAAVPLLYGAVPLLLLPAIARAYRRRLAAAG